MLKEKFEHEGTQLEMEKKKAIEELNHVKQIKEDLMHRNQKILDSFDNELDGTKKQVHITIVSASEGFWELYEALLDCFFVSRVAHQGVCEYIFYMYIYIINV